MRPGHSVKGALTARGAQLAPEVIWRRAFDGIVHHVGPRSYASHPGVIHRSDDNGHTWQPFARLPLTFRQRLKSSGRLARRLFRAAIHHVVPLADGALLVFGYRRIRRFDATGRCLGTAALLLDGLRTADPARDPRGSRVVVGRR